MPCKDRVSSDSVFFSVVVPYFRNIGTISTTLQSLLAQSHTSFEVIIVDDASKDSLSTLLCDFQELFRKRAIEFKLIILALNVGPSGARNAGWRGSSGKFVAFLDADDAWHPQKLELCERVLLCTQAIGCVHDSELRVSDSLARRPEQYSFNEFTLRRISRLAWLIRNQGATPSIILRKDISQRFDETMRYCEDYDLWLRVNTIDGQLVKLMGPPLTFLGRRTLSEGGQSSSTLRMRLGELRAYYKFFTASIVLWPALPLFFIWSILKHLVLLFRIR